MRGASACHQKDEHHWFRRRYRFENYDKGEIEVLLRNVIEKRDLFENGMTNHCRKPSNPRLQPSRNHFDPAIPTFSEAIGYFVKLYSKFCPSIGKSFSSDNSDLILVVFNNAQTNVHSERSKSMSGRILYFQTRVSYELRLSVIDTAKNQSDIFRKLHHVGNHYYIRHLQKIAEDKPKTKKIGPKTVESHPNVVPQPPVP